MKEPLKISIPKPCTQSWTDMSGTTAGKYCSACQQEVKDFTKMNGFEIQQWFQLHQAEKTCGRFYKDQITAVLPSVQKSVTGYTSAKLFLLSLLAFPLSLKSAAHPAKSKIPVTVSPVAASTKMEIADLKRTSDSTKVLKGIVLDGDMPVIGASIMIKGTDLETFTDGKGEFQLDLSSLEIRAKPILIVGYIGYEFQEEKLNLKDLKPIKVLMTEMQCLLGEVEIKKPGLFKRIFRRL